MWVIGRGGWLRALSLIFLLPNYLLEPVQGDPQPISLRSTAAAPTMSGNASVAVTAPADLQKIIAQMAELKAMLEAKDAKIQMFEKQEVKKKADTEASHRQSVQEEHKRKEEELQKSLEKKQQAQDLMKKSQEDLIRAEQQLHRSTAAARLQTEELREETKDLVDKGVVNMTVIAAVVLDQKPAKRKEEGGVLKKMEEMVATDGKDASKETAIQNLNSTLNTATVDTHTALTTVVRTKKKTGHETKIKLIDSDMNEYVMVKSKDSEPLVDSQLMSDTVVVLVAATVGGLTLRLMKLPALLGFILAGVVIGPAHLAFIQSFVQVETFAQLGVTFLLYALGMEFSLSKLKAAWKVALIGGGGGIFVTMSITWICLAGVGTGFEESIFTGAFLSMSSTAVVLKCMEDVDEVETPHGHAMVGILIAQDIGLGIMLGIMPVLENAPSDVLFELFKILGKILTVLAVASSIAKWVLPTCFSVLLQTNSEELWVLGIVSLCLVASSCTEAMGLSIETGAFLAGILVKVFNQDHHNKAVVCLEPLRDIFAALFFTCIGVHVDVWYVWANLRLIVMILVVMVFMKVWILSSMVKLCGYPIATALKVGIALAQIGEFSFVLAAHGRALGLVSVRLHKLLLHATVVSLVLTPFMIRATPSIMKGHYEGSPCTSLGQDQTTGKNVNV